MAEAAFFPGSRELFRLARDIADHREAGEHMSDVDLGRVVGFESARTSRWKYGRIAVADAARLLALSQALDLDLTLLSHVSAGYLSSQEALGILESDGKLVRFLGEQAVLAADDQSLALTAGDGTQSRILRRACGHYHRVTKRFERTGGTDEASPRVVLLADDHEVTITALQNLVAAETGIVAVVARTGPEALLLAGERRPDVIIFDLFQSGLDGFAAVRALAASETTRAAEIIATSLALTPDITRAALGVGALEVVQRPLRGRVLGRIVSRLRRRG